MTALALILLSLQPALSEPVETRCAAIELNHFYDGDGKHVFSQWIFWSSELPRRNSVRAWRMRNAVNQAPYRDGTEWVLLWVDHGDSVAREVRAPTFLETWTQTDEEVAEREILPPCERSGLGRPRP